MALIRWEPFGMMDDMFDRMLPSLQGRRRRTSDDESEGGRDWLPSTDISETDQEYLIRAELPAVRKEDVHVTAEDGRLTIAGERRQQSEERNERFHRVESCYGSFARSFSLPENVDAEKIRCESRDGVLTVHIPKREPQKKREPRQIRVE
jgi:HSP20 family protein